jgi:hypothetical protein
MFPRIEFGETYPFIVQTASQRMRLLVTLKYIVYGAFEK